MRRRMVTLAVAGAGAFAGLCAAGARPALAGFKVISESVRLDESAERFIFNIVFSQPPDFVARDESGAPSHAFQYEIDSDYCEHGVPFEFDRIDTIVRGSEIHHYPEMTVLPVRSMKGDGGPHAGGWGRLLDLVPFEIDGSAVSFSLSQDLLNDTDGQVQYRLIALDRGEVTSSIVNRPLVPLPTAAWSGMMMLGGVALIGTVRRLRRG